MERKVFNPYTHKQEYEPLTRAELARRRINDTPTAMLSTWAKENPGAYQEDRQILGITSPHEQLIREHGPKGPKVHSEAELEAMAEFSEADVRRFYVQQATGVKADSVFELMKSDPAKAARLRIAALARGIPLPERAPVFPKPKAPEVEKADVLMPETLAKFFGYPEGYHTTPTGLAHAAKVYNGARAIEAKKERTAAEVARLESTGLSHDQAEHIVASIDESARNADGDGQ